MDFKRFTNEIYLDENTINQMRESYLQTGVIKLENFLKPEVYNELIKLIKDIRGEHVKIADRYSYEELGDLSGVGKLFSSKDFLEFVSKINGGEFSKVEYKILGFGHKDYTLLHDAEIDRKGTEFLFFFCEKWKDDFGGYLVYTDNEDKSLIFTPAGNNFVLINKDGLGGFVKYINNLAKDERIILVWGKLE
ncbi:MAG: hypothetical protein Q7S27_04445 [Nanoarchaeota archaeon]|nr:hypothetical protein [Nanoarchaeota archaeon]